MRLWIKGMAWADKINARPVRHPARVSGQARGGIKPGTWDRGRAARKRQRAMRGRLSRAPGIVGSAMPHSEGASPRSARSYERLGTCHLRLGRAAHAELDAFFTRNPAPCQLVGPGAHHRPRARRRRTLPARPSRDSRPRHHRLLRRRPAPAAPFPPHGRLLELGSPPSSGAARTTRPNTPAAPSMSPSGSSPTDPARSPGCAKWLAAHGSNKG